MKLDLNEYASVLVVADTGSGKTSIINDYPNPERLAVLNVERKKLPTRNANKIKNVEIKSYKALMSTLEQLNKSDDYDAVLIDSHSSVLKLIEKYCSLTFSGFEIWRNYNLMIDEFHDKIKDNKKPLFITALPETREGSGLEEPKMYARTKGKEHRFGGIESNFTVVVWANNEVDENDNMIFQMTSKPNKYNTAKAPFGMFEDKFPNSIKHMIEKQNEYYK